MADIATQTDSNLKATERDLIAAIAARPSVRKVYVAAAEYFDSLGEDDTASSLHNGVVPAWLVEKYLLEKYESKVSGQIPSVESAAWYPATSEKLTAPINKDANRNSVFNRDNKECPHEALNILHYGGFVYDGTNKLFIDSDNIRISNHSDVNSFMCHGLSGPINNATKNLDGLSILLSARNSGNFYHWHFDILPVLGLVEECGVSIGEIDNIVLTDKEASFQLQMLKLLGVRDDQIKVIQPGYETIRCERLLLATVRNNMGMRQPRKHIDWLRSKFLGSSIKLTNHTVKAKKIAVIRDVRGYTNTDLVTEFFKDKGYMAFKPENYSYEEQVAVFHNASHIVSPHGAGLALLAYCKPGTVVHEFYGEHVHPCFWSIASTLGLRYYNYNCSQISQASVTNSGRGMTERLNKSINLTAETLASLGPL